MLADATKTEPSTLENEEKGKGGSTSTQGWHTLSSEATAERLKAVVSHGLTQTEAKSRHAKSGPNTLPQAKQRTTFEILLSQFRSLIVLLLAIATAIAFAMGDHLEAIAILVVIILNAAIGFFTEWKASHALTALQKQFVRFA